jgi:hypothetical protein
MFRQLLNAGGDVLQVGISSGMVPLDYWDNLPDHLLIQWSKAVSDPCCCQNILFCLADVSPGDVHVVHRDGLDVRRSAWLDVGIDVAQHTMVCLLLHSTILSRFLFRSE